MIYEEQTDIHGVCEIKFAVNKVDKERGQEYFYLVISDSYGRVTLKELVKKAQSRSLSLESSKQLFTEKTSIHRLYIEKLGNVFSKLIVCAPGKLIVHPLDTNDSSEQQTVELSKQGALTSDLQVANGQLTVFQTSGKICQLSIEDGTVRNPKNSFVENIFAFYGGNLTTTKILYAVAGPPDYFSMFKTNLALIPSLPIQQDPNPNEFKVIGDIIITITSNLREKVIVLGTKKNKFLTFSRPANFDDLYFLFVSGLVNYSKLFKILISMFDESLAKKRGKMYEKLKELIAYIKKNTLVDTKLSDAHKSFIFEGIVINLMHMKPEKSKKELFQKIEQRSIARILNLYDYISEYKSQSDPAWIQKSVFKNIPWYLQRQNALDEMIDESKVPEPLESCALCNTKVEIGKEECSNGHKILWCALSKRVIYSQKILQCKTCKKVILRDAAEALLEFGIQGQKICLFCGNLCKSS